MDAIGLLKKDHAKVKALFKEVEGLSDRAGNARQKLFGQIDQELELHAQVEEQVFYPAFKKKASKDSEKKDEVLEAYEEHALVKHLLGELKTLEPRDETYKAKLSVLMELVLHHVKEEESEMFKMARELFKPTELETLGRQLEEAKQMAGGPV
ncbi:MAG: hemerythrin domain-containing protein [Candidatus Eremiobacteraeota bacterium]|nr:hemerythrin domain-containing protein [Candidatus Eremiobacteraeota bacterium]